MCVLIHTNTHDNVQNNYIICRVTQLETKACLKVKVKLVTSWKQGGSWVLARPSTACKAVNEYNFSIQRG